MKKALLILAIATLLTSCRTQKPTEVPVHYTVTTRDSLIVIPAVQDSGSLKALFACDSNNKVILLSYNNLYSQYMSAVSAIEPIGDALQLTVNTHTNHPATQAKVTNSVITRDKPIYMPGSPYPVDKELNWLQKTLIYTGAAALVFLLIFIIVKIYNPLKLIQP